MAMFIRAGWQDAATVNGTLGRYNTISNAQQVFIGPWDHGARNDADPFRPDETPVAPDADEQFAELVAFFDQHLKDGGSERTPTEINYYTLGADRWTRTETWPPSGLEDVTWYFGPDGTLTREAPSDAEGEDTYTVDFTATTGTRNRWYTNGGGGDVVYGDRSDRGRQAAHLHQRFRWRPTPRSPATRSPRCTSPPRRATAHSSCISRMSRRMGRCGTSPRGSYGP